MSDAEVLRRNNMSQKRKTRNAIEVISQMVEAGEVDKLWRDFHLSLKSAREKTVCCFLLVFFRGLLANLDPSAVCFGLSMAHRALAAITSRLGVSFGQKVSLFRMLVFLWLQRSIFAYTCAISRTDGAYSFALHDDTPSSKSSHGHI